MHSTIHYYKYSHEIAVTNFKLWDRVFPSSHLNSITRTTSDHVPLVITAATRVPRPSVFRFENSNLLDNQFLPTALASWSAGQISTDGAANLAGKLKLARSQIKNWTKNRTSCRFLDNDCKFVIDLFDFLEELRELSAPERLLRQMVQDKFTQYKLMQASYWKQRGKVKKIRLGIDNTHFFKAHATQNHRRTFIRSIKLTDMEVSEHSDKATTMFSYYNSILGASTETSWSFDLHTIYHGCAMANADELVQPFSEQEIFQAIKHMDKNSAPGPDGFGPGFFQAAWAMIKPDILHLLQSFYDETADMERINRAFIVLIPKPGKTNTPDGYRPISLQNCSVKIIAKVMANSKGNSHLSSTWISQVSLEGEASRRTSFMQMSFCNVVSNENAQLQS